MITINIEVQDKRPTVLGSPVIVCGNSDYELSFTFDSEWEAEPTKTARFLFVREGKVRYEDVVFMGTTCQVPVLAGIKEVRVGVFAGNLITSTPAVISCEPSILCGTGAPEDPTPEEYHQLVALVNDYYSELVDSTAAFIENQEKTMEEYQEQWSQEVEQAIRDAANAGNLCLAAISDLEVSYHDMDGGDPTTTEEAFSLDVNGGYPTA